MKNQYPIRCDKCGLWMSSGEGSVVKDTSDSSNSWLGYHDECPLIEDDLALGKMIEENDHRLRRKSKIPSEEEFEKYCADHPSRWDDYPA